LYKQLYVLENGSAPSAKSLPAPLAAVPSRLWLPFHPEKKKRKWLKEKKRQRNKAKKRSFVSNARANTAD
jgi:hypothetical protein